MCLAFWISLFAGVSGGPDFVVTPVPDGLHVAGAQIAGFSRRETLVVVPSVLDVFWRYKQNLHQQ